MHLILTGATGMVGSAVLDSMISNKAITRVSILSRRPVAMAEGHEKVKVILHQDFKKYESSLLEDLKDANGCVWALGVSQNAVDKQKYIEITKDYTLEAAKAFSTLHPDSPFTFIFVSGEGATQTAGLLTSLYGRVKGETEARLLELGNEHPQLKIYNIRPAIVDSRAQPNVEKYMPQLPAWRYAGTALFSFYKSFMTPTGPMSKLMTDLAMSKGEPLVGDDIGMNGRLVSNVALRRLAGL